MSALLDHALTDKVLQGLFRLHPLPPVGIATGQAVCDQVMAPSRRPPRDIDIVLTRAKQVEEVQAYAQEAGLAWATPLTVRPCLEPVEGPDGQLLYRIVSKGRLGLLNFVWIEPARANWRNENLFGGLDLNCVQVALDLSCHQMLWSLDFETFLRDKVLRITNSRRPAHSLLRLLRKLEELPGVAAYAEATALECAKLLARPVRATGDLHLLDRFPRELLPVFRRHEALIGAYLSVVQDGDTLHLRPRQGALLAP